MAQILNTTAARGESDVWRPTGNTVVQADAPEDSNVVVELHGRIDDGAPWAYIASIRVARETFIAVSKNVPQLKLIWHKNDKAQRLMVWSVEN